MLSHLSPDPMPFCWNIIIMDSLATSMVLSNYSTTLILSNYTRRLAIILSRGGHTYTCCTDTRDWDQSEIKQSSCKIGDDQVIKIFIRAAQIKVKFKVN